MDNSPIGKLAIDRDLPEREIWAWLRERHGQTVRLVAIGGGAVEGEVIGVRPFHVTVALGFNQGTFSARYAECAGFEDVA